MYLYVQTYVYIYMYVLSKYTGVDGYCSTVVDGYCSTVQGLLDWFEVDLGFTELWS